MGTYAVFKIKDVAVLFGIIYMVMTIIGVSMGIASFYFYLLLFLGLMFLQYMMGSKIIKWSMQAKYMDKAVIPKPKVGPAQISAVLIFP